MTDALPGLLPLSAGLWAGDAPDELSPGGPTWTCLPQTAVSDRTHELPDPAVTLPVAGPGADTVLELLERIGRRAVRVETPVVGQFGGRLWRPNPFLAEELPSLTPGRAVDLGCGSGRETCALLGMGWSVTAIDVQESALERTRHLAQRYLTKPAAIRLLTTICADLEREKLPETEWDLAVSLFFLHREGLVAASRQLKSRGVLLIEAFTDRHASRFGKPRSPERRLRDGEWAVGSMIGDAVVVSRREGMHGDRHTVRIIARKL